MSNEIYTLKFTPLASEDLEQIYIYISENLFAEIAAENLVRKMESSILRLKEFPFSCSYVSDELLRKKGHRKLVVDNYIIFYIVNEKEKQVVVMRILYGAQNYNKIL